MRQLAKPSTPPTHQSLNNLLGKCFGSTATARFPPDNPFYHLSNRTESRHLGARTSQPLTRSRSGPETGRCSSMMSVRATWEEINDGVAGANYGLAGDGGTDDRSQFRSPRYASSC